MEAARDGRRKCAAGRARGCRRRHRAGLDRARPDRRSRLGHRLPQESWPAVHDGLMSELDVIIIHIRAEQAAEYERLFAEHELPRWREYKARGAFLSARISRVAFGTDDRKDVVKYAIAVEVPDHAAHSEHDADPAFRSSTGSPTCCSRKAHWSTAASCCTRSERRGGGRSPARLTALQNQRSRRYAPRGGRASPVTGARSAGGPRLRRGWSRCSADPPAPCRTAARPGRPAPARRAPRLRPPGRRPAPAVRC